MSEQAKAAPQKNTREKLEEKKKQIEAQIQALNARESAARRKEDTRKKIIIGGVIMKAIKNGDIQQERIDTFLGKYLDNDRDRQLFGLSAKAK